MRLAIAQLNFTVGAFDGNVALIADAARRAMAAGAELLITSELATTGYPPRDLLDHPRFIERNLDAIARVASISTDRFGILAGFVDRNAGDGKPLHNAVALCQGGRVAARRHKVLLPTYDVFDEDRYFEPGRDVSPIEFNGRRLGVTICEDVWNDRDFWPSRRYHRDPVCDLAAMGADLLVNISASPFTLAKPAIRRDMIRREAVKHRRPFVYVNQTGGNDELVFDGHSIGIGAGGAELFRGRDFEEDFIVCDVTAGRDVAASIDIADAGEMPDERAARKALVLGLRDYAHKCGFSGAVLGLSGGIDSALTACLAAEALGPDHVLGVAMPSRYSSAHSLADAEALARALGIQYRVVPIDGVFQAFVDALAPAFAGRTPDVTEENLQARARGSVLMALSNKLGSLLLSTGNKSELAVGYCTLYGDMCGGLAVISDVPKTLVYRVAAEFNRDRPVIPESTMTKPPSAELRPDQKDSDSLPPYDVLDRIVEAYVERHLDVDAIAATGIDRAVVSAVVSLITKSEYKRRQAAPGLKITSKAFGAGRRYPIAADYRPLAVAATTGGPP